MDNFATIGHNLADYLRARSVGCTHWGDGVVSINWNERPDLRVYLYQDALGDTSASVGVVGEMEDGGWIDADFVTGLSAHDFARICSEVCEVVARFLANELKRSAPR